VDELNLFGLPVEINLEKGKVFIYDICGDIQDGEAERIINYLFAEGFLSDDQAEIECVIVSYEE